MTGPTVAGLLLVFVAGLALGWMAHAHRTGDRHALRALSEDAARRHSGVIGQQVGALVEPLHAALGALNEHVEQVEKDRVQAYSGLREQVIGMQRASHQLSTQTGQLVAALRAPQVRGRWGEIQLERVVELAGMSKHCDFDTQVRGDGVRPDLIVRLAGGKQIIVDAKVPFTAYLDAAQAQDADTQQSHLSRHARHLRDHIDALSAKAYWAAFEPSPEFVVLFLPGDPFLDAALSTDPDLLERAFSRNVILATPTTLIALLRTIAHMWRQETAARDVVTVQRLGAELYDRLGGVAGHLDRVGTQLGKAVESFNLAAGAVETRVLVTARKLHDLQIGETETPDIRRIEVVPRRATG